MSDVSKLLLRVAQLEREREQLCGRIAEAEGRAEHEHNEMQTQAKLAVDWCVDCAAQARRAEKAEAELRDMSSELDDARCAARGEDQLRREAEAEVARLREALEYIRDGKRPPPPAEQVKGPALTPERIEAAFAKGFV